MKKFSYLFTLLLTSFISYAQTFNISGVITEEYSSEPLTFADVVLYKNDKLIDHQQSGIEDGSFVFDNLENGNYKILIRLLGYQDNVLDSIIINDKSVSLDTIHLAPQEVLLKPIIYLYPTEITDVQVKLEYNGNLMFTYPKYPKDGWMVQAHPDGTLIDKNGQSYYGLFWEGSPNEQLTIEKGFIIKGEETVTFLEEALATLGLNRREAMEFIIFWQPRMELNKYNLIHFSTEQYEELAKLHISPKPETIIRVMMAFKPLDVPLEIEPQNLQNVRKDRKGFTVVEWGGTQIESKLAIH